MIALIQENVFEHVVCKMVAILPQPQFVSDEVCDEFMCMSDAIQS